MPKKNNTDKIEIKRMQMRIDRNQYQKIKKEGKLVFFSPDPLSKTYEEDVQWVTQKGFCDGLIDLESVPKYDGLHKQQIVFNQVIARYCTENGILVYFDLEKMIKKQAKVPLDVLLRRMMLVIALCKKYNVQYDCYIGTLDVVKSDVTSFMRLFS